MNRSCDQCGRTPEVIFAIMANGTQLCQGCYMNQTPKANPDPDTIANIDRLTAQVETLKWERDMAVEGQRIANEQAMRSHREWALALERLGEESVQSKRLQEQLTEAEYHRDYARGEAKCFYEWGWKQADRVRALEQDNAAMRELMLRRVEEADAANKALETMERERDEALYREKGWAENSVSTSMYTEMQDRVRVLEGALRLILAVGQKMLWVAQSDARGYVYGIAKDALTPATPAPHLDAPVCRCGSLMCGGEHDAPPAETPAPTIRTLQIPIIEGDENDDAIVSRLMKKAETPAPTCPCAEPKCSGVNDGGHHQCGGPAEACMIPGCPECGTPVAPAASADAPAVEHLVIASAKDDELIAMTVGEVRKLEASASVDAPAKHDHEECHRVLRGAYANDQELRAEIDRLKAELSSEKKRHGQAKTDLEMTSRDLTTAIEDMARLKSNLAAARDAAQVQARTIAEQAAKLGRAVAALREAARIGAYECPTHHMTGFDATCAACLAKNAGNDMLAPMLTILADADSAQAGEAWREGNEDIKQARDLIEGVAHNLRYEPYTDSLRTALTLLSNVEGRRKQSGGR